MFVYTNEIIQFRVLILNRLECTNQLNGKLKIDPLQY